MPASLERYDHGTIPSGEREIRLFAVVRNEALRLPYWLAYYTGRGVDRFFVVDNGSTDDTRPLLAAHPRTHVFGTDEGHDVGQSGRQWILPLLSQYGHGRWCVVVDADEIFVYPGYERLDLRSLTQFLDDAGSNGLYCHLLDMYSDRPIRDTTYASGDDPLRAAPWFDAEYDAVPGTFHDRVGGHDHPIRTHVGGMRRRVFGIEPYCSKVPLFRYDDSMVLARGWHDLVGLRSSDLQGAVLHFKFLFDFPARIREEANRPERCNVAREYAAYAEFLNRDPALNLYHAGSHRFTGSAQLVDLGIMKTTHAFNDDLTVSR